VEKYFRAGLATDDNMAHAHCMQNTKGYRHTLRMCNIFFMTEKVVARTRRIVTLHLYVACLVIFAAGFKFCPPTHLFSNGLMTYLSPHSYLVPRLKVTELHITLHTNIRGQRELHILVFLSVLLVGFFGI
jgi:hypothetical protein